MLQFPEAAALVVAGDTRTTVTSIDRALLESARLTASILEASEGSGLPHSRKQKLLEGLSSGMNAIVASRAELGRVIAHLTAIKGVSNLRETADGCPDDWDKLLQSTASIAAEAHVVA